MQSRYSVHFVFFGMIIGILLGGIFRFFLNEQQLDFLVVGYILPVGQIFLKLIFMMVLPLIVSSLILGISSFQDFRLVGKIGFKTLFYAALFTLSAVLIGVGFVNLVHPGSYISEEVLETLKANYPSDHLQVTEASRTFMQVVVDLVPKNPLQNFLKAFEGGLLPLIIFSIAVGLALASLPESSSKSFRDLLKTIQELCGKVISYVMRFAPLGVAAFLFAATSTLGWEILKSLFFFLCVITASMVLQILLVYVPSLKFLGRSSPLAFFHSCRDLFVTAFATSSSSAVLPLAMDVAKKKLRIQPQVGDFVLTLGAASNHNGTALYEGVSVLFLAELFSVPLNFSQQLSIIFVTVLSSFGTAGAPGASLPVIAMILGDIGIPPEAIGVILGIDRILDMMRTVINIAGDMVTAVCVNEGVKTGEI